MHIFVPWNEVVVLDPVELSGTGRKKEEKGEEEERPACTEHKFDRMKPLVLATWKNGFQVREKWKFEEKTLV